jgi:hypothetical protein
MPLSEYQKNLSLIRSGLAPKTTGKKAPTPIAKKSAKKIAAEAEEKKLFEADKLFYLEIWKERPHRCECCGKELLGEPLTVYFHHLLEKERYDELRHIKENIMLLCADDHTQVHSNIDKVPEVKRRRNEAIKLLLK